MSEIDLDLSVKRGSFHLQFAAILPKGCTVVFGASGAGKSTLLKAIAGLVPAQGHMRFGAQTVLQSELGICQPLTERRIGYVFQEPRLMPHMTVQHNMMLSPHARLEELPEIADMLDITPLLKRRPHHLSGGEAARVALGRALLSDPHVLLMDEPLASLDHERKREIYPYLQRLRDQVEIPIVFVTHAMEEVLALGTHLAVLKAGQLMGFGALEPMLARADMARALGLRASGALLRGTVVSEEEGLLEIKTPAGPLFVARPKERAILQGDALGLRVLAQDVLLSLQEQKNISALNQIPCSITDIAPGHGPGVVITLETKGHTPQVLLARITKKSCASLGLHVGQNCFAIIKAISVAPDNMA